MTSRHLARRGDGAGDRSSEHETGIAGLAQVLRSDWLGEAACTPDDGDSFFAEARIDVATALLTCSACPVRNDCLTFALTNDERYGIWGRTTPDQRRRLARADAGRTAAEHRGGNAPSAA